MHKIFTANDRAKELRLKNHRDLIAYLCKRSGEKWNGIIEADPAFALPAFVDFGRWLVKCECGNVMYAEPSDPIAFCNDCGNVGIPHGNARQVIFPDNRIEIEAALMERELGGGELLKEKMLGKKGASQTMLMPQFAPVVVSRSWNPGETADDLRAEHEQIKHKD